MKEKDNKLIEDTSSTDTTSTNGQSTSQSVTSEQEQKAPEVSAQAAPKKVSENSSRRSSQAKAEGSAAPRKTTASKAASVAGDAQSEKSAAPVLSVQDAAAQALAALAPVRDESSSAARELRRDESTVAPKELRRDEPSKKAPVEEIIPRALLVEPDIVDAPIIYTEQPVPQYEAPQPAPYEPLRDSSAHAADQPMQQRRQNDYNRNAGRNQHQNRQQRPQQPQQQRDRDYDRDRVDNKPIKIADVPEDQLALMSLNDLNVLARRHGIMGAALMTKPQLIEKIIFVQRNPDVEMEVEGVLEKLPDGFGFLRSAQFDYVSGPDDIYVSPSQIRRFNLRVGDVVTGVIRKLKENEKYFALLKVNKVNYEDPALTADRRNFDRLTPLHPDKMLKLERDPAVLSTRIIDLFAPIGKGQRGLIVAQPKVGKTVLLKEVAQSVSANYPDVHLIILLIDERPEEVADMRRSVHGVNTQVISSTFDESAQRHVQVAELVLEKAKRLVEMGKDVVILLDSITRLARAYNTVAPASGKVLTGGIDATALQRPKRFFGAARSMEEGGTLTIIATSLIDTGSRMDEVIYEEFKGTGNMEMHMTRKLSNRRIYPALDLMQSGTRRDDLLQSEDTQNKVWVLQKFLATMNTVESMEFLIEKMKKCKTNDEFLDSINKKNGAQQ